MSDVATTSATKPVPRRLGLLAFVDEIGSLHREQHDTSFCWMLGAGASIKSGIPAASTLAEKWFREVYFHHHDKKEGWEDWLRAGCSLPGVDAVEPNGENFARLYSAIYRARFSHMPHLGQRELEKLIDAAQISYGYYVLAEVLTGSDPNLPSRHNIVVTPNFDNLVADSLSALGKRAPIVIGHHALAEFASPTRRRPLILKFHHDYLYNPLSDPGDLARMEAGYAKALDDIFRRYTPVVIGYGGNDPSLMDLLAKLPPCSMPGGMYWCVRRGSPPPPVVADILQRQRGTLVEIPGFDELFALLEKEFAVNFQPEQLQARATDRVKRLKEARSELQVANEKFFTTNSGAPATNATGVSEAGAVLSALNNPAMSGADPKKAKTHRQWWEWEELASVASEPGEKEKIYLEGLADTNNAHQLVGNYAIFLEDIRKDYDGAEKYYRQALESNPSHANNLGNYASFLKNIRKDYDGAEKYYRQALEADPSHANHLGNYASFLKNIRKDYDGAEKYYRQALESNPSHADNLGNYAIFLENIRKDYDGAEKYYQRALEADPSHANNLANYASFLKNIRKDYDGAEKCCLQALAADPNHANNLGNYANLLADIRKDYDGAEKYYQRALEADPESAVKLRNYALFLKNYRKDKKAAEKYFKQAEKAGLEANDKLEA